jgi:hypothetical protein
LLYAAASAGCGAYAGLVLDGFLGVNGVLGTWGRQLLG